MKEDNAPYIYGYVAGYYLSDIEVDLFYKEGGFPTNQVVLLRFEYIWGCLKGQYHRIIDVGIVVMMVLPRCNRRSESGGFAATTT